MKRGETVLAGAAGLVVVGLLALSGPVIASWVTDSEAAERPSAAIENRARSPGLDVISHGGEVTILAEDSKAE